MTYVLFLCMQNVFIYYATFSGNGSEYIYLYYAYTHLQIHEIAYIHLYYIHTYVLIHECQILRSQVLMQPAL